MDMNVDMYADMHVDDNTKKQKEKNGNGRLCVFYVCHVDVYECCIMLMLILMWVSMRMWMLTWMLM